MFAFLVRLAATAALATSLIAPAAAHDTDNGVRRVKSARRARTVPRVKSVRRATSAASAPRAKIVPRCRPRVRPCRRWCRRTRVMGAATSAAVVAVAVAVVAVAGVPMMLRSVTMPVRRKWRRTVPSRCVRRRRLPR